MKRVAIFGANGYLGKHLAIYLQKAGINASLFDLAPEPVIPNFIYHQCNITDRDFWKQCCVNDFDVVYFFAGLSGPENSFLNADTFIDVNEKGLLYLLQQIQNMGTHAPKILFPSSRLVYRGNEVVTEDSALEPRSIYAVNKVACEGLLSAFYHRFHIPYTVLRICVPYGNYIDRSYSYGTIGFFIKQANEGHPITVYGNGENTKTYTHIWDICEIFLKLGMNSSTIGVFNAGGFEYSLQQVALMIANTHNGTVVNIPWPEDTKAVEMGSIALNAEKLANAIGFSHYRRMEEYLHEL